jgi:catechol 2,3-dioxygenase-like lactoylglutathione lyase family enzyme
MPVRLAHITLDCHDPAALAGFWSAALDRPVDEGASEYFASIDDKVADRPSWFFIAVPEGKSTKNRLHVDLTADDRPAEVERLVGLGARALSDHDEWGAVWTVLADPEGNEFCVGQQPATSG